MYQIDKPTFSVRLNEDEQNVVNEVLQHIQSKEEKTYTFAKDVFMDVIEKAQSSLQPVETNDPLDNPHLSKLMDIYRENFDIPADTGGLQLLVDALTRVNEPLPEAPTVEVEKEVERKLSENEVLISFTPDQFSVIKTISDNRNKRLEESMQETPGLTIKKMALNKANVYNWHGNFFTGLK